MTDNLPTVRNIEKSSSFTEDIIKTASSDEETRKCPFCKERIISDAIKCKHCGSLLVSISDNFPSVSPSNGLGNSVQIVTNTQVAEPSTRKSSDYIIAPPANSNSMLGHGWSVLVASIIFVSLTAGSAGTDATGAAVLGAIIVAPWAVWLLSKPSANKVLPAIALILVTLVFIGVVNG